MLTQMACMNTTPAKSASAKDSKRLAKELNLSLSLTGEIKENATRCYFFSVPELYHLKKIVSKRKVLATVKKVEECFNPNTPPPPMKSIAPQIIRITAITAQIQLIRISGFIFYIF
jgi:hypothetical protein